jgi:hypothetical protein
MFQVVSVLLSFRTKILYEFLDSPMGTAFDHSNRPKYLAECELWRPRLHRFIRPSVSSCHSSKWRIWNLLFSKGIHLWGNRTTNFSSYWPNCRVRGWSQKELPPYRCTTLFFPASISFASYKQQCESEKRGSTWVDGLTEESWTFSNVWNWWPCTDLRNSTKYFNSITVYVPTLLLYLYPECLLLCRINHPANRSDWNISA